MTITDRDIRNDVLNALLTDAADHDVDGIVREVIDTYGLVDVEDLDTDEFWKLVQRHARPQT